MDDPRRVQEQQRRRAGLFRRLGIMRTPKPHPRVGGARGYPVEMRESEIWSYDYGLPGGIIQTFDIKMEQVTSPLLNDWQ